jgi:hypothetical protein
MPKFLEDILKREAASKGLTGRKADRYTYGLMNDRGYMRGNQPTAKGDALQAKHDKDQATKARQSYHKLRTQGGRER